MGGQQKISQRARNEIMDFSFTVSHKPAGLDLMQNCDLPPPSKVYMGPDKAMILSMNRIAGKEEEYSKVCGANGNEYDNESDKMELLKALQSSQTRAREAEKKVSVLRKKRNGLSNALLEEAMLLFAYRQQVRLLELQVLNLQSKWLQNQPDGDGHGEERPSFAAWILALAISWGIGVTTALACRYLM